MNILLKEFNLINKTCFESRLKAPHIIQLDRKLWQRNGKLYFRKIKGGTEHYGMFAAYLNGHGRMIYFIYLHEKMLNQPAARQMVLLHEMVHYDDYLNGAVDLSHTKAFHQRYKSMEKTFGPIALKSIDNRRKIC